jgi:predicted transport protein
MVIRLIEKLASNGTATTQALFYRVHSKILSLDQRIQVKPNNAYVGYCYANQFAQVYILKGSLKVYLVPGRTWDDPQSKLKLHGSHLRTRKYQHFKIASESELQHAMFLISQAMKVGKQR